MNYLLAMIEQSSMTLAAATKGNPVLTTITIMLFYVLFTILESGVEKLIFGERFEHWLDPFFIVCFIAYAAYSVWACAVFNSK